MVEAGKHFTATDEKVTVRGQTLRKSFEDLSAIFWREVDRHVAAHDHVELVSRLIGGQQVSDVESHHAANLVVDLPAITDWFEESFTLPVAQASCEFVIGVDALLRNLDRSSRYVRRFDADVPGRKIDSTFCDRHGEAVGLLACATGSGPDAKLRTRSTSGVLDAGQDDLFDRLERRAIAKEQRFVCGQYIDNTVANGKPGGAFGHRN